MPRLRFETAQDLFETYPAARVDVGVAAGEEKSLEFLQSLSAANALKPALSFCAYLLARHQAVAWGCRCLREGAVLAPSDETRMAAAEAWVRDPEDRNRLRALDLAGRSDTKEASTWICYGAGWAGGAVAIDEKHSTPTPQHATAQAVRVALILGANALPAASRADIQRRWLDAGVEFALG